MRRLREVAVPTLVLLGFAAVAVFVLVLLNRAQDQGVQALENSLRSEVNALASSQNQQISGQLQGSSGILAGFDLEFVVGSENDRQVIEDLNDLLGSALDAGFYLVGPEGQITDGLALIDPDQAIGSTFAWPGLGPEATAAVLAQPSVLPVAEGYTSAAPVIAFAFPVYDEPTRTFRGAFVLETVVAADSAFNEEIQTFARGQTGEYLFLDSNGVVIAANDPSLVAARLEDDRILTGDFGLHRFDEQIVVLAPVPAAGWRVAFRQDADEFEEDLSQPIQDVGQVLVVILLIAGAALTLLLDNRLRTARAERDRLRQLNESQEEFISIVSHELRTPVAGILGFLQTTLDHWETMSDRERSDALERAATNARRLQGLTRDVLAAQSIEEGHLSYEFEPVDLADEIRTAVQASTDLTPEIPIETRGLDLPAIVRADPDRIQQVLTNLLDNAVKNSPPDEPVRVTLERGAASASVTVRDQGPGLEPEARQRIFDKFVRGRDSTVTGTGLGLFIVRRIVEAHGGRISVGSDGGEGAEFRFEIPLADDEQAGT